MKLRYYLRGLGIGVFVTALLMGIALKDRQPLSDAEIRVRAMELGMVDGDSRTLAGNQEPRGSEENGTDSAATQSPEPTTVPTATPVPAETSTSGAGSDSTKPFPMVTLKPSVETPEPTDMPTIPSAEPTQEPPESVTIVVQRGQGSYGVAEDLMEAGLIEDAAAFDRYLEENGYSKRINPGTYEIPMDSTEEEIAKIITKSI